MKISISVGILSFKRTDLLIETLCCLNSNYMYELVILNNNDYCILNEIQGFIPKNAKLVYLWDGINYGVSSGRRKLINATSKDVMIILDDDIYLDDFDVIIDNVINEFSLSDKISALAFNIKEFKSKKHNRYEIPHKNKKINMHEDFYTYLIIGAANAISVKDAKDVGNFPDDFGLYGFEEIDLAFRLINNGGTIKYINDNVVYHKKSPDGRFDNDVINYHYFVNRTKMAKRYFKFKYYISCFIIRSLYFLIKTKNFKLYKKAWVDIKSDKKYIKFNKDFYTYIKDVKGFIWY